MGNARPKPKRLAEKLQQIRLTLGLSQPEMLRRLGLEDVIQYARISEYETGIREPSLMTLLQYARIAGVHMEVLVDDELDLPEKLPGPTNHDEIKRNFKSRRKKRW
ncbi:MAG TPA: helix-turn-helix transcriptional regulator [Pyrinomonadaceae bacterium]|jgi:transcriptional regulator with XRE-family HTH domain|nr:helix-turn-helix transcriptional regulator [Pyrinomonadaceae bacterium]